MLLLSLVSTGLALYVPLLARDLVDRALLLRDAGSLLRIVTLFLGMTAASFGLNVAAGLAYTRASARILFDMRLEVYRHLQRLSPRFYTRTRVGELVSRVGNDIAEVQRVAAETILASVGNALFLAGSVGMLLALHARLFALTALFVPPALWALSRYRRRLAAAVAELRQRSADVGSFLVETLQGMSLIVAANAQEREARRFQAKNDAFLGALQSMQLLNYLAGGLPGLILALSAGAVFLLGGQEVIAGRLSLGTFVAFMAYQARLLPPLQALMGLYAGLASARVSLGRVQELLDAPVEVVERPDARPLPTARGDVAFEDVSLAFERGPVLERVTFEARAGEVVAIVGPSGAGKSTIADLLLRMLDPDTGTVRLDGADLRGLRLSDVRRHVALVEQAPFLFHASIAENVRYARPQASDAEVEAAAARAGIGGFVDGLPERYATVVGERGRALSAGERQRIAIARAFLADPAVLVLDEPTAALDPLAEREVVRGYEALMKDRTTILISHRFLLAQRADRVVVLEGARIVEDGPPAELLSRGERFARLFAEARPAEGGRA